jgi:type IV pilus assembly protein PilW
MNFINNRSRFARRCAGFSLIELMVAMVLGLVLTFAMINVFISSKTAFKRQEQLNSVQQGVRIAFEYLANDARMVGHLGCYTGRSSGFNNALPAGAIATNYALGVEGYEYTTGAVTLASNAPSNTTDTTEWVTNIAGGGVNTIPLTDIAGSAGGDGLTPGSDLLVIRTVAGKPVRLSADTVATDTNITVENFTSGKCSGGSNKVSGLCNNSHVMLAGCQAAGIFSVASAASAPSLALSSAVGAAYVAASTEVFPMQSVAYYVKRSSSGLTTSLYRRIFDGDNAGGLEQELIEGVENLQLRYGLDSTLPPDGVVDVYQNADQIADWKTVVAIRMSLLLRASDPVEGVAVPASGVVNGVAVTYPSSGSKYDRRVFTTTIAVRNRISYF